VLNAASVAPMVLTTETAVVEKPEAEAEHDHDHGHAH
jgi:chaperonin GroEL